MNYGSNQLEDGFDFETFLQSNELAKLKKQSLDNAIIRTTSGSISTISSFIILCMLYRSHDHLSTTHYRLIFGLCIADIISSVPSALNTLMVPLELDYLVWRARGNIISCNVQGFLLTAGTNCAQLYNASLCLHYLAIVRYEKTDNYIRNNIEPWLHAVSILYPVALGILGILKKVINSFGISCGIVYQYRPPHCTGYKDGEIPDGYGIPCGRGGEKDILVLLFFILLTSLITVVVIVISMAFMYRAVRASEKKMERYGTRALKMRIQQRNSPPQPAQGVGRDDANGDCDNQGLSGVSSNTNSGKKPSLLSSFRLSTTQRGHQTRIENSTKSRVILQRAFAYTLAWFVTYSPRFVILLSVLRGGSPSKSLFKTANFLTPLQGFFNFLVFLYPRVLTARRSSRGEVSWWKAFSMAMTSRENTINSKRRRSSTVLSQRYRQGTKKIKATEKDRIYDLMKELNAENSEEVKMEETEEKLGEESLIDF